MNAPPSLNSLIPLNLREHPLRLEIDREFHARPSEELESPCLISHLGLLTGPGREAIDRDRAHIARLCTRFGLPTPPASAVHLSIDCETFRLKWERHSEFAAYTFITSAAPAQNPFAATAIQNVPPDWLAELAGELLVASHLTLCVNPVLASGHAPDFFNAPDLTGSRVADGTALVWSDFQQASDGFTRILVVDEGMQPSQAGRLIQRLLNIETYRIMAMLGFPLARQVGADINQIEDRLTTLTRNINLDSGLEQDHALLAELSELAARTEQITASTTYRFGASRAYYTLVERRIAELHENPLPGVQNFHEFVDRRLAPAMRTVEATRERQDSLSSRIARAANLLRTRVDVALEHQNRDLLHSMDRRADLQLRLQETVEGLSVVVLSYYLIGLISYAAKALNKLGLPLNPDLIAGLAIPVIMIGVGLGIRRMRQKLVH